MEPITAAQRQDADRRSQERVEAAAQDVAKRVPLGLPDAALERELRHRTALSIEGTRFSVSSRGSYIVLAAIVLAVMTPLWIHLARDGFGSVLGVIFRIVVPGLVYSVVAAALIDLVKEAPTRKQADQIERDQKPWLYDAVLSAARVEYGRLGAGETARQ